MKAKEEAQKFLADVPEEYVFWCHDGKVIRNMKELAEALIGMTDETFGYHSNIDKRDFSCWVRDVIGDEKLARDLEDAPNRTIAAGYVTTRIASLQQRADLGTASTAIDSWYREVQKNDQGNPGKTLQTGQ